MGDPMAATTGLGIRSAAFSPDGTELAYSLRRQGLQRLARSHSPPTGPRPGPMRHRVTSERAFIELVDVSPDGQQLAVSSDRRGNQDLWVLPATGGEMTPLTTDPTPDWNPRWSPDGSQIAFYAYRSGNRDIWVMPARGGPARQLTTHPASTGTRPGLRSMAASFPSSPSARESRPRGRRRDRRGSTPCDNGAAAPAGHPTGSGWSTCGKASCFASPGTAGIGAVVYRSLMSRTPSGVP